MKEHFENLLNDKIKRAEKAIKNSQNFISFLHNEPEDDFVMFSWMYESATLIKEILGKDSIYYEHFRDLFKEKQNNDTLKKGIRLLTGVKVLINKQELLIVRNLSK